MNNLIRMHKLKNTLLFIMLFTSILVNSQRYFSNEIGVIAGPVAFQSDFGQRNNFETDIGNTGFGVGLVYFLNFDYLYNYNFMKPNGYFDEHFKIRAELSYNRTNFNFYGDEVRPEKLAVSAEARKLKAMTGSSAVTNLGGQIEFYPLNLHDFSVTEGAYAPFISLGTQFSYYEPSVTSSIGALGSRNTTLPKYLTPSDGRPHGYSSESGTVWSIVSSIGTRYKLNMESDLLIDMRAQYYFSNWVDGLNPNPDNYPENKAKDWLIWLNFGYVRYF